LEPKISFVLGMVVERNERKLYQVTVFFQIIKYNGNTNMQTLTFLIFDDLVVCKL